MVNLDGEDNKDQILCSCLLPSLHVDTERTAEVILRIKQSTSSIDLVKDVYQSHCLAQTEVPF